MYCIYLQIGKAVYNGLYVLASAFVFNILCAFVIQQCFKKMMKYKDERISLSKDLIEGMKSIKYLSWEEIFDNKIQVIRAKEYLSLTIARSFDGLLCIFWNFISYFLIYTFLMSYIDLGHTLKDTNVFVIIALFAMLTAPIGRLPWCFNQFL